LKTDLFVIGEVVKTRGLRGCVKVLSEVEAQKILHNLEYVFLEDMRGQSKFYRLRKMSIAAKFLFLELEGVTDLEAARKLVGDKVLISKEVLEELPKGEYYWHDIIGMDVVSEDGISLGRIESIFPTGSNDVYVCKGKKEILIPAIADVIIKIDLDKKEMTVKIPEGL